MVVKGEVLNNFPRFVSILVAEFAAGGTVNLTFKMKGDMIIENSDLKPMIDAMMRDFLELQGLFCNVGGNIAEACGSASGQAEHVVGQDGLGGSDVGVVIGLSVNDGQGGAGGASVDVGSQDSDNELLIPTPWSDESKNEKGRKEKGTKVMKDKVSQEHVCEELNKNIGKQSGDLVEMPSEAVEQGMDDHDEIDGAKSEEVPNHVVKKGNLQFLIYKQVVNHGGDDIVDKGRPLKRKRVYDE
ncbi:hypothetical protein Tco_1539932 [Tanacetum coccineum]